MASIGKTEQSNPELTIVPFNHRESCPIACLPSELLIKILALLTDPDDKESAELTCRSFHVHSSDPMTKKERAENLRIEKLLSDRGFNESLNDLATLACIPDTDESVLDVKTKLISSCIKKIISKEVEHFHIPLQSCQSFISTANDLLLNKCRGIVSRLDKNIKVQRTPNIGKCLDGIRGSLYFDFALNVLLGTLKAFPGNAFIPEVFFENASIFKRNVNASCVITVKEDWEKTIRELTISNLGDHFREHAKHEFDQFIRDKEKFCTSLMDGSALETIQLNWMQCNGSFTKVMQTITQNDDFLFSNSTAIELGILQVFLIWFFCISVNNEFIRKKAEHPEIDIVQVDQKYNSIFLSSYQKVLTDAYPTIAYTLIDNLKKNKSLNLAFKNAIRYYLILLQHGDLENIKRALSHQLIYSIKHYLSQTNTLPPWLSDVVNSRSPNLEEARKLIIDDARKQKISEVIEKKRFVAKKLKELRGPNQFDGTVNSAWLNFKKTERALEDCYKNASDLLGQAVNDTTDLSSLTVPSQQLQKVVEEIHEIRIEQMKAERAYRRLNAQHDQLAKNKEGTNQVIDGKFLELFTLQVKLENNDTETLKKFEQEEEKTINEQFQNLQDNIQFLQTLLTESQQGNNLPPLNDQ